MVAYPWLASAITRSPILIALAAVASRLPWLIFTLPAGVITDRFDRKKIIVAMDAARGFLTVFVAVMVYWKADSLPKLNELTNITDLATNWPLYIVAIIASFLFGYMKLRFGINFEKIAPVNNIPHADAHILLIHGEQDETIPLTQGQALDAAGNAEKSQLWVVPGKGHSDCDSHPQFWEKVGAFLQITLPVPK